MKKHIRKDIFIEIQINLLTWYYLHHRNLPWRQDKNPYRVWVSETMLQQTQVNTVIDYFNRFMLRFPSLESLANSHCDEVLNHWRGLGYYTRALNLHKASQQIMTDFEGEFPSTFSEIIQLKGVGKYTASAISSICFQEEKLAVDGNLYRVLSRLFADDYDTSKSSAFDYFSQLGQDFLKNTNPGLVNQAFMDLGSGVCRPKNPVCSICPLMKHCVAFKTNTASCFPLKTKKTKVSDMDLHYSFIVFQHQFLVQQRDAVGIWKNLHEIANKRPSFQPQKSEIIKHKLSHINMKIHFSIFKIPNSEDFFALAKDWNMEIVAWEDFCKKTFPKPIESFIKSYFIGN